MYYTKKKNTKKNTPYSSVQPRTNFVLYSVLYSVFYFPKIKYMYNPINSEELP